MSFWLVIPSRSEKNMSEIIYCGQSLTIYPTYVVSIPIYHNPAARPKARSIASLSNLKDNNHDGQLSTPAQKKIKNAINWLLASAKLKRVYDKKTKRNFFFKANLVTLTIPKYCNTITEKFFKVDLLHTWLSFARYQYNLKNYVWKIEFTKAGTMHAHITTDTFIHHKSLREGWNRILFKKGLLHKYIADGGNSNPNSTDIHSVRNIKNLGAYIAKYLTKNSNSEKKLKGKIWGCNYELSHSNRLKIEVTPDILSEVMKPLMNRSIEFKQILGKPDLFGTQRAFGEIYFMKPVVWKDMYSGLLRKTYDDHRFHIRHSLQKIPQENYSIN